VVALQALDEHLRHRVAEAAAASSEDDACDLVVETCAAIRRLARA
jgi:hypothetical protein